MAIEDVLLATFIVAFTVNYNELASTIFSIYDTMGDDDSNGISCTIMEKKRLMK